MDLHIETDDDGESAGRVEAGKRHRDVQRRALDEAHARVKRLEEKLTSQARARTELVHLVSHEMRTPITIISGFGRLLQNEVHGTGGQWLTIVEIAGTATLGP